jgi:hypothetical protein
MEAHQRKQPPASRPVNSEPRPCLIDVGFPLSGPQDRTHTSDLKRHAQHTAPLALRAHSARHRGNTYHYAATHPRPPTLTHGGPMNGVRPVARVPSLLAASPPATRPVPQPSQGQKFNDSLDHAVLQSVLAVSVRPWLSPAGPPNSSPRVLPLPLLSRLRRIHRWAAVASGTSCSSRSSTASRPASQPCVVAGRMIAPWGGHSVVMVPPPRESAIAPAMQSRPL